MIKYDCSERKDNVAHPFLRLYCLSGTNSAGAPVWFVRSKIAGSLLPEYPYPTPTQQESVVSGGLGRNLICLSITPFMPCGKQPWLDGGTGTVLLEALLYFFLGRRRNFFDCLHVRGFKETVRSSHSLRLWLTNVGIEAVGACRLPQSTRSALLLLISCDLSVMLCFDYLLTNRSSESEGDAPLSVWDLCWIIHW